MTQQAKTFWKIVFGATLIFFLSWVAVYKTGINQLPIQSEDTLPALFLPATIIKEQTLYLDTYFDTLLDNFPHPEDRARQKGYLPFYLRQVGEHYVSAFPIITPLLALPVYFIAINLGLPINMETVTYLGHLSGALIVAFSGGFLYLLLRKHFSLEDKKAQILTAIYLFATVNFAMVSQALWQHGTVQLFFILALWFMFEKRWFYMSLMLSLAIVARPTAALVFPFLSLIFIEKAWHASALFLRPLFKYISGLVLPILFFAWYTGAYYTDISNHGYANHWLSSWQGAFPEGFLGMWLSPSKGILIYSPVIVFSLVGAYLALRKGQWRKNLNYVVFVCIVILHTAVLSIWKHWFGGWSFGYRMASDIIPFLIILMVPYVASPLFERTKKWFFGTFVFSVLVQVFGIVFFDGIWHAVYDDGFKDTGWLWSIRDSEFAFNVRRVLVKLGLLERACPHCLPGSL